MVSSKKVTSIETELNSPHQSLNMDLESGQRQILENPQEENVWIEKFLVFMSYVAILLLFPFSLFMIFTVIRQFERVVVLRNGKLRKEKTYGPGIVFYLPCVDILKYVDLRICSHCVRPQEALTRDSLTVSVDAVLFYKIKDPVAAVIKVYDYKVSTQYIATSILRNALGTRKLSEILANRRAVSRQVFEHMSNLTFDWGVKILRVEIKDIRLPMQMQKAMAAEAEALRFSNAKIKVAKAEIECTKSLLIATNMLLENPWAMSLRYMQSIQSIAGKNTHTIVIPFSPESMKLFLKP